MRKIKLTRGKYALVDDRDFNWLNQWKWCFNSNGYANRRKYNKDGKAKMIYMHRLIKTVPEGFEIDHVNRNKLDNRRKNIRIADSRLNKINRGLNKNNTSGHKGVYWHKQTKKWLVRIVTHYEVIHLGMFRNIKNAILTRENAERKYHEA